MIRGRLLKNRAFRDLWIGQTISQLGDSMYYLVFLFMADHVSKNPMVVGLVGALAAIPFVIFGPIAGVWVDRADRRKLMLGADVFSGLITGVLAIYALVSPSPAIWVLCLAAFLMSTVNTVFFPARSASIPRLVGQDEVVEANSLSEATRQVVAVVGLAISVIGLGVLYEISREYFFFAGVVVNSLTFFGSAWFIRRLPELMPLKEEIDESIELQNQGVLRKLWKDIGVGLQAIWRDPVIKLALPISMVSTIGVAGFFVVYLALNREWYGGSYASLAGIELCFAIPMMIASIWVGRQKVARPGRWIIAGQVGVGITVAVMAICKPYWSMLLINVVCGLFLPLLIIPMQSYFQLAVPDQVRGRVHSTYSMVTQAMNPLGLVLIGPLLKYGGIEGCLVTMGVLLAGAGLLGFMSRGFLDTPMPGSELQAA